MTGREQLWVHPRTGLPVPAETVRTRARLAAWQQMRMHHDSEVARCDAMADAVLDVLRTWLDEGELP